MKTLGRVQPWAKHTGGDGLIGTVLVPWSEAAASVAVSPQVVAGDAAN